MPSSSAPAVRAAAPPKPVPAAAPTRTAQLPPPKPVVPVSAPSAPNPVSPATAKADQAYLAGKYEEALKLYQQAVQANRGDLDAHDGLSRTALVLQKFDVGCRFYEDLLKGDPNNAGLIYGAARMYLTSGDRQMASAAAYRSLRFNKDLARSYFLLGLMMLTESQPKFASAERAFQQTLERDPACGPAYFQLGRIAAGVQHDLPRARQFAKDALKVLRPVEKDVRFECQMLLGALYVAEKQNQQALDVYNQALAEHGNRVYEVSDVGLLQSRMGRTEEAKRTWQTVVTKFGLADRTGLRAFRQMQKLKPGVLDYSAFLPASATKADYAYLLTYLGEKTPSQGITVPKSVKPMLDDFRTPIAYLSEDLDGDGKEEIIIVDARLKQDVGDDLDRNGTTERVNRLWRTFGPMLYIFTNRGGLIGQHDSRLDQFYRCDTVDLDGDGKQEVVFTGFSGGNVLNVVVLRKREVRWQPVLVLPVVASDDASGVLLADIDGDGKIELMTVSGDPAWVSFYRLGADGAFAQCDADFPQFYRDYVARNGKLPAEVLDRHPELRASLKRAQELVGGSAAQEVWVSPGGPVR